MNNQLERFEALDKVIINLETEAEKLGAFSGLVAQVDAVNKDVRSLIDRQMDCHQNLQALVTSSEEPVRKIRILTEQLETEVGQVNRKQTDFNESIKENQTEQFRELLDRQEAMTNKLSLQVEEIGEKVKNTCHDDLDQIIRFSEKPLQKIMTLTEQLQQEITQFHTEQSEFQDRQLAAQGEHFQELLKKQENVAEALQDGVQGIAREVRKIDPALLDEMRLAYNESQTELSTIRGQLEQIAEVLSAQQSQVNEVQNQVQDYERTVNLRFTKLEHYAERLKYLPDAVEEMKSHQADTAEEATRYREAEEERQKLLATSIRAFYQFAKFSKIAFLVLMVLVIITFFVGA